LIDGRKYLVASLYWRGRTANRELDHGAYMRVPHTRKRSQPQSYMQILGDRLIMKRGERRHEADWMKY
jgi:hypothetical protein